MKKIITLTLVLAMTLALAVPAMATTDDGKGGTIEVTGAVLQDSSQYTVYTVYKMFDVADGNTQNENKYKATTEWIEFVKQTELEDYFVVQETENGTYMIWRKNTASTADAAAIAELARDYVAAKKAANTPIDNVGTVQVNGAALDVEDNGYYLLIPNNTTASGVIVVKNDQNKTITEKSVAPGMPVVEKTVYEDSLLRYVDSNTTDVGETIQYKVTITAGQGASHYILHDKMDDHIQVDYTSGKITRDGNEVSSSEYTVVNTGLTDGCSFHVVFDEKWCEGLNDGTPVILTYTAKLLYKDAEGIAVETDTDHINTAWLTHTAQAVETPKSSVSTQTREINVLKVDQNKAPLAGAGFVLRDNEGKYYQFNEEQGKVTWTADKEQATVKISDQDGKLQFYGVDAEIFYLDEKIVPGGYTGVDGTAANVRNESIKAGKTVEAVQIVNTLGQKLPETGGIGTTVFYIGGALLVVVALGALVIIKRKETSAQ